MAMCLVLGLSLGVLASSKHPVLSSKHLAKTLVSGRSKSMSLSFEILEQVEDEQDMLGGGAQCNALSFNC